MYRANHVYVLLSSLVNVCIGLYSPGLRTGWRGRLGALGGALIIVAPLVLLYAFFYEAPKATPERTFTFFGVLMLLLGVGAQWPNRARA
jgi:hypothetical protein